MEKYKAKALTTLIVGFFGGFLWNVFLIINKSKLSMENVQGINNILYFFQNFFFYFLLALLLVNVLNLHGKRNNLIFLGLVLLVSIFDYSTKYATFIVANLADSDYLQNIKIFLIAKYGIFIALLSIVSFKLILMKKKRDLFVFISSFLFLLGTGVFYGTIGAGFVQFVVKNEALVMDEYVYALGADCKKNQCVEFSEMKNLNLEMGRLKELNKDKQVLFGVDKKTKEITMVYYDPDLLKLIISKLDRGIGIELLQSWIAIFSTFLGFVWIFGLYGLYAVHKQREFKKLIKQN